MAVARVSLIFGFIGLPPSHLFDESGGSSVTNPMDAPAARGGPSAEAQALHLTVFAPSANQLVEFDGAAAVQLAGEAAAFLRHALVVVVAGGACLEEFLVVHRFLLDRFDPFGFRLGGGLDASRLVRFRVTNKLGDMARLLLEHMRKVRRERILGDAHVEAVGEADTAETVKRLQAVAPIFGKRLAAAAEDLEAGAAGVGGAHLESGGEDDAVG